MENVSEVGEIKIVKEARKPRKKELEEELKVLRTQLEEHDVRLNGGVSPGMKKEIKAVDKELLELQDYIEVKRIEKDEFYPVNAEWGFQKNPKWLEFNKKKIQEVIDNLENTQRNVMQQKLRIEKEVPELHARIQEIKQALSAFSS